MLVDSCKLECNKKTALSILKRVPRDDFMKLFWDFI